MKKINLNSVFFVAVPSLLFLIIDAQAAPIVYPAKGQSAQQQQKDDGACYSWAKNSTGVDPAAVASASAPPAQTGPGNERLRGAARGALGGAAIGAIAGDTGKGAAIGATAGTLRGGSLARQRESEQQAAANQASANTANAIDTYHRAYSACMEGRGYTIK